MYLDVLLLTNFLMAYFLLLAAGALSGQRGGFVRMLAGSGLAAMSSLILFAPPQPYLMQVAYKITTALAITAAAFGWRSKRRLVTAACWYAALNIALAGAVLLAVLRTGTRAADTANPDGVSARFAAAFIGAVGRLLRRSGSWPATADAAGRPDKNRRAGI